MVGDDDQAIYQWRGSNVDNIVTFDERYPGVTQFRLLTNRRSRPAIVELANEFAQTIPGRLPRRWDSTARRSAPSVSIAVEFDDEPSEAERSPSRSISCSHDAGRPLPRHGGSGTGQGRLPASSTRSRRPESPSSRVDAPACSSSPRPRVFGATYAWLAEVDWAPEPLRQRARAHSRRRARRLRGRLRPRRRPVSALRGHLIAGSRARARRTSTSAWCGTSTSSSAARHHVLGHHRRRSPQPPRHDRALHHRPRRLRVRHPPLPPGRRRPRRAGRRRDRRRVVLPNFALLLVNYANGNYDDFDGEEDLLRRRRRPRHRPRRQGPRVAARLPAVAHRRAVPVQPGRPGPGLAAPPRPVRRRALRGLRRRRAPPLLRRTDPRPRLGLAVPPRRVTPGSKQTRKPSPYLLEAAVVRRRRRSPDRRRRRSGSRRRTSPSPTARSTPTSSARSSYLLRNELGFMPPMQTEIGYGNAVHHVMRLVAEHTQRPAGADARARSTTSSPTDFFLPFANKAAHKEMREKARELVHRYVTDYSGRPAPHLGHRATVRALPAGRRGQRPRRRRLRRPRRRARQPGHRRLQDHHGGEIKPLQLQVYADAGRREGLTVGGAFIHDLAATATTCRRRAAVGEAEPVSSPRKRLSSATSPPPRSGPSAGPATSAASAAPPRLVDP